MGYMPRIHERNKEKNKTMITPNIQKALESNGVRFYAKDFLMEGLRKDCVDAVHDAKLVHDLLRERMEIILGMAPKFPETQNNE
jgi:spore germination protein YaaH